MVNISVNYFNYKKEPMHRYADIENTHDWIKGFLESAEIALKKRIIF
jgi:hypothetical protein